MAWSLICYKGSTNCSSRADTSPGFSSLQSLWSINTLSDGISKEGYWLYSVRSGIRPGQVLSSRSRTKIQQNSSRQCHHTEDIRSVPSSSLYPLHSVSTDRTFLLDLCILFEVPRCFLILSAQSWDSQLFFFIKTPDDSRLEILWKKNLTHPPNLSQRKLKIQFSYTNKRKRISRWVQSFAHAGKVKSLC